MICVFFFIFGYNFVHAQRYTIDWNINTYVIFDMWITISIDDPKLIIHGHWGLFGVKRSLMEILDGK
jgi:hypothetical protein